MKGIILLGAALVLLSCAAMPSGESPWVEQGVFVNQAGYLPDAEKYFITNVEAQSFRVIHATQGDEVHRGTLRLRTENDPSTGLRLFQGDFSALTIPGTYQILLDTGQESYPFELNENLYNDVAAKSLKSFYFQRCGVPLEENFAGEFARPACHIQDGTYHASVPESGTRPSVGGWHDAGDYGKYIHSASTGLAMMTLFYEQFPEKFNFDQNGIPESHNGISDFLDEIQVELDWMLTMQNNQSSSPFYGACHYMINTRDYSYGTPQEDPLTRYVYDYSTVSTGDFTAIMAQAARLFQSLDPPRAEVYRAAALRGWGYLERQPEIYPQGGFIRPGDTHTGGYCQYGDPRDTDERLWAAVELYITTGEESYHTAAKDLGLDGNEFIGMSWEDTQDFARLQYLLTSRPTEGAIRANLGEALYQYNQDTLDRMEGDGFMDSMGEYFWGGNGALMAHGQYLLLGSKLFPERREDYERGALRLLNYLLGTNPHNMSFVTKVGTVYPRNIHHAALASDNSQDIYPGVVTGGPNQHTQEFPTGTPPGLCYRDEFESYATNENCILYNAPLVGTAFYFATYPEP